VDFIAGEIKSITNHPLRIRIYSANFLQCMNVNNECFDICNTQVSPKKKMSRQFGILNCNLSDSLKNLPTLFQKWFEYFYRNKS
jgi:hypothetical protein